MCKLCDIEVENDPMRSLPYTPGELWACQWPTCLCEEGECKAAPELIEVIEQCSKCHCIVSAASGTYSGECFVCALKGVTPVTEPPTSPA